MSDREQVDRARREIWRSFADQFLDTDTRYELPFTALTALEAGLDVEQAERIWWDEVEPAVGFNLCIPLGEWAGFDDAWLVERIPEVRRARRAAPSPRHSDLFEPTWLPCTPQPDVSAEELSPDSVAERASFCPESGVICP